MYRKWKTNLKEENIENMHLYLCSFIIQGPKKCIPHIYICKHLRNLEYIIFSFITFKF